MSASGGDRLCDILRVVALSEGIPSDTPPSLVYRASRLRLERDRQMLMALSASICAGISINFAGGDTDRLQRPFYSDREWKELEAQKAEVREEIAQRQMLAKIKRLMGGQTNG